MISDRFFKIAFQAWIAEAEQDIQSAVGSVCTETQRCYYGQPQSSDPPAT